MIPYDISSGFVAIAVAQNVWAGATPPPFLVGVPAIDTVASNLLADPATNTGSDYFTWVRFAAGVAPPVDPVPVPEPATLGLFVAGALGAGCKRRRRK